MRDYLGMLSRQVRHHAARRHEPISSLSKWCDYFRQVASCTGPTFAKCAGTPMIRLSCGRPYIASSQQGPFLLAKRDSHLGQSLRQTSKYLPNSFVNSGKQSNDNPLWIVEWLSRIIRKFASVANSSLQLTNSLEGIKKRRRFWARFTLLVNNHARSPLITAIICVST